MDILKRLADTHLHKSTIIKLLEFQSRVHLKNYIGSSTSLLLDSLSPTYSTILVVTPDFESSQFFAGDLNTLGNQFIFLIPPSFQKPYQTSQLIDSTHLVERSELLDNALSTPVKIIIISPEALFEKFPEPEQFRSQSVKIKKGDTISPDALIDTVINLGYERVSFTTSPGEFSQRGGIIDVYPLNSQYPNRLEFWGDEIDSIREFDADSQRSISFQDTVHLVPLVGPLLSEKALPLTDLLPNDTLIYLHKKTEIKLAFKTLLNQVEERYEQLENQEEVEQPNTRFYTYADFSTWLDGKKMILSGDMDSELSDTDVLSLNAGHQTDFNASVKFLREHIHDLSLQKIDTYILCDSNGQLERLEDVLGETDDSNRYTLLLATLHAGFVLNDAGIAIYTDHQIFNRYHKPNLKYRKQKHAGISLKEMRDLNIGDFVVHIDFGIGQFAGFRKITVKGIEQESVMVKYKGDSILYVNVGSLHKLQKYSGKDGTEPTITKLGSGEWQKKKTKTKSRLRDIARDLIQLYAKRKAQKAFQFSEDTTWQTELEASFLFEETPDQKRTIEEVKTDMMADFPMDRLVCGDVGFGKTEVAVRAAFKAVMDGKQVAVLVPTTILAEQHYKTFSERIEHFPVTIEVMNRFKSSAEQNRIKKSVQEGGVDILIGTHRITSKDIVFKELGLMIIDEEQRFGVSVKEKLKSLRATVDVLTLTATPIPRTLHMSLIGARDLSIIKTPPPNRQPVFTEIHSYNDGIIKDAIMTEVSRGGQVFFIHNRVKNIVEYTEMVRKLIPNVRVRFAHGQLQGSELERIITDFYHHKFDVLLSTNIVENGIDISNANTIIINNAHQFGLSELHQLRGRVGRSNRKAFCYLLTPSFEELSVDARKRLLALEENADLGAGFNIAMRDLNIRGAGDVLGAEQSGFINELGFELYNKILNEAIRELRETEFADLDYDDMQEHDRPDTSIEIDHSALLDKYYVQDDVERLNLYRKLAVASNEETLTDWKNEVEDRFGPLTESADRLFHAAYIKLFASSRFIEKVTIRAGKMWLQCPSNKPKNGNQFFDDNRFQLLLTEIQEKAADRFKITQKDDILRFVIDDIFNMNEAKEFLSQFYVPKKQLHTVI